jgi:SAM-dependent methyltransferase
VSGADALLRKVREANARVHDEYAPLHDRHVPYIWRKRTRAYCWNLLRDACSAHGSGFANARVLEIGCATGTFTDLVIKAGAKTFTGIDLSPRMIELAREKAHRMPDAASKITYQVGALEDFASAHVSRFDVIFSSSFLHHLAHLERGLADIRSMLAPGGVYVAIHEVIWGRCPTTIEVIDAKLQYVCGYNGASTTPLHRRVIQALPYRGRIMRLLRRGLSKLGLRTQLAAANERTGELNYVDYQLNEPFSLSRSCSAAGMVKPYCYLGFVELMRLAAPLNHEMLIMTRER